MRPSCSNFSKIVARHRKSSYGNGSYGAHRDRVNEWKWISYLPRKSSWSGSLSNTSTSNSWPGTSWTITWHTYTHTHKWTNTQHTQQIHKYIHQSATTLKPQASEVRNSDHHFITTQGSTGKPWVTLICATLLNGSHPPASANGSLQQWWYSRAG